MEPQNIKAIFFDIDGTLVSFQTHGVPSSAARAIETLRSRGTKVFIATGRPFYQINNLGELRFDGYVTLNGAWCIDAQGEVIFSNPIPHEDLEAVNRRLDPGPLFPCAFMTPEQVYINLVNPKVADVARMVGLDPPPVRDLHEVAREEVLQVNIYVGPEEQTELMRTVFTHCGSSRWNPAFADVNIRGNNKSTGIDKILARYDIPLSETMSFGDGGNDIPMLCHTGIGIAMGNASDQVKQAADYVTDAVDYDGIANALRHFGLI